MAMPYETIAEAHASKETFASVVENADRSVEELAKRISVLATTLVGDAPPTGAATSSPLKSVPVGLLGSVEDRARAIMGNVGVIHGLIDRIERALP